MSIYEVRKFCRFVTHFICTLDKVNLVENQPDRVDDAVFKMCMENKLLRKHNVTSWYKITQGNGFCSGAALN